MSVLNRAMQRTLTGYILEQRSANPQVESAVTRLLVAIKQLLESLTHWSNGTMTETEVSDVFVDVGNKFHEMLAAFASHNIDMT